MHVSGEEGLDAVEPPAATQLASSDALLSPSIQRLAGEKMAAFEMKFLIGEAIARQVEAWAAEHMQRDAYADVANGGAYQTTTLYLDTPQRDVFRRCNGHRSRKFRLRRYGSESTAYLERKSRKGDRVAKRRSHVPLAELTALTAQQISDDWSGAWFRQSVTTQSLLPACRLTYDRTAFVRLAEDWPLRLTLDRRIRGLGTDAWDLTPLDGGHAILPGQVICEFKFRVAMPALFKQVITSLQLEAGSVSKYRRMMIASGAAPADPVVAAALGEVRPNA